MDGFHYIAIGSIGGYNIFVGCIRYRSRSDEFTIAVDVIPYNSTIHIERFILDSHFCSIFGRNTSCVAITCNLCGHFPTGIPIVDIGKRACGKFNSRFSCRKAYVINEPDVPQPLSISVYSLEGDFYTFPCKIGEIDAVRIIVVVPSISCKSRSIPHWNPCCTTIGGNFYIIMVSIDRTLPNGRFKGQFRIGNNIYFRSDEPLILMRIIPPQTGMIYAEGAKLAAHIIVY